MRTNTSTQSYLSNKLDTHAHTPIYSQTNWIFITANCFFLSRIIAASAGSYFIHSLIYLINPYKTTSRLIFSEDTRIRQISIQITHNSLTHIQYRTTFPLRFITHSNSTHYYNSFEYQTTHLAQWMPLNDERGMRWTEKKRQNNHPEWVTKLATWITQWFHIKIYYTLKIPYFMKTSIIGEPNKMPSTVWHPGQ